MGIKDQLLLIQRLSGLTQEQLARRLGVTFAAFNRWVNGRANPRPKSRARIDRFYKELTGQKEIPKDVFRAKKLAVLNRQKTQPAVLKTILSNPDIKDQFLLSLTYNSNRIEGS